MQLVRKALYLIAFVAAAPAAAGPWISGGGKLLMDGRNPWFLHNTPVVRYCTKVDEANFGLSEARVRELIRAAFDYWRNEFLSSDEPSEVMTGLQDFRIEECGADTDLAFQFGVLDEAQRAYLGRPEEYVGIAVRTDYDVVNLRGRGFLYFSPQGGELALRAAHLAPRPWSLENGNLLFYALAHELGHVFGFGHVSVPHVMEEDFAEMVLHRDNAAGYARYLDLPEVFRFRAESATACGGDMRVTAYRRLFGVRADHACIKLDITPTGFSVYARKADAELFELVGQAVFDGYGDLWRVGRPLRLYATREQHLFEVPGGEGIIYLSPWVSIENRTGAYRSVDGTIRRNCSADLVPSRVHLSCELDGMLVPNVLHPMF